MRDAQSLQGIRTKATNPGSGIESKEILHPSRKNADGCHL
jgi:hypothetical protein